MDCSSTYRVFEEMTQSGTRVRRTARQEHITDQVRVANTGKREQSRVLGHLGRLPVSHRGKNKVTVGRRLEI